MPRTHGGGLGAGEPMRRLASGGREPPGNPPPRCAAGGGGGRQETRLPYAQRVMAPAWRKGGPAMQTGQQIVVVRRSAAAATSRADEAKHAMRQVWWARVADVAVIGVLVVVCLAAVIG